MILIWISQSWIYQAQIDPPTFCIIVIIFDKKYFITVI